MARKAVYGYPEKSYYDNTRYNGIAATNDPLNEGFFALLSNVNITDTGMSLTPREGFLTTTLKVNDEVVVLSKDVLIFYDNKINKHIILDTNTTDVNEPVKAYKTQLSKYNIKQDKYLEAEKINNIDLTDLHKFASTYFPSLLEGYSEQEVSFNILTHTKSSYGLLLKPIIDSSKVQAHINKVEYNYKTPIDTLYRKNYWIKIYYREKENRQGAADTLVVSYINTDEQVTTYLNRNIASKKSIIPDPLRYKEENNPDADTQPLDVLKPLLFKDAQDKYILQYAPIALKTDLNINIVPSFYLQYPELHASGTGAKWAYKFDVISMSQRNKNIPYTTGWRELTYVGDGTETPEQVNENIEELSLAYNKENYEKDAIVYYVIADHKNFVYTYTDVSDLETYSKAEEALAAASVTNNVLDSQQTENTLGNMLAVYYKHNSIASDLNEFENILNIDEYLFEQNNIKFIAEASVRTYLESKGTSVKETVERTKELTALDVTNIGDKGYVADTTPINSPLLYLTEEEYNDIPKLNISQLKDRARANIKPFKFVLVPFKYEYIKDEKKHFYFCSVGGIYIEAIKKHSTFTTTNTATFKQLKETKKTVTALTKITYQLLPENIFNNFNNLNVKDLIGVVPLDYFDKGVFITLYLKPYNNEMLEDVVEYSILERQKAHTSWGLSSYIQSGQLLWTPIEQDVVYLNALDEENPDRIEQATDTIIFENRLITFQNNSVYISEEGDYYHFLETMKKDFPEKVMKVVPFKNIVLVFTTQNLYAIFRQETERIEEVDATDNEGSPIKEQKTVKEISWVQQPVLYNINPSRKYLDVIQVYNQMILFYSEEGQLYMIRPSTQINSDTQFNIQYFNKSANDILANYENYITERLITYNKLNRNEPHSYIKKEDVDIHTLLDIDNIKIFFSVPDVITFILVYDVVNNRYTTYDTLTFTDIKETIHTEGGEIYVTKEQQNSYITLPYTENLVDNNNVDMSYTQIFKKYPIFTFIDTGTINLNNHIVKRLRDFSVSIKNIDAKKILYNAAIKIDDTLVRPLYNDMFSVKAINGVSEQIKINKVPVEDMDELFGRDQTIGVGGERTDLVSYYLYSDEKFFENNKLLKTETLNSNAIIEYNSSVLGIGKNIRINLQFVAKGKYKISSFGLIFKERRV